MNIYISGSMAYDRIMDFPGSFSDYILPDKIHVLNVCFNVDGLVEKYGGTAGNIAYSLSVLREKPFIIATIGKDYQNYFEWLRMNNIPVEGIKIIPEEFTAGAYITTDRSDNQITGFNPGAMKYPSGHSLKKADPKDTIVLLAPGNVEDMTEYALACRNRKIPYICDPGQSLTKWEKKSMVEWLDGALLLITNDYELEIIMKMTGLDEKGLLELSGTIITTLGEKGSVIVTKDTKISIPAARAGTVVDPTGAGDAYRAGLLKGLVTGRDLPTAAKMGAVAAVYAIEHYGTQEHRFTYDEYLERYSANFGEPPE
ncbi:MAG TPA: carbohydrate kinase family protein [Thermodesulfovibrionales bacterium]|nr:carbohydrate kinase family protein [Thermodesulfovibrionales bacterium]